jgi:hypothetical protein
MLTAATFFSVKMVLAFASCQNFAIFSNFQALGIRLGGFDGHDN